MQMSLWTNSLSVLAFDEFGIHIHAANTVASIVVDVEADEASIAPPFAPGVLQFPVVV